jgi:hypothetical protein
MNRWVGPRRHREQLGEHRNLLNSGGQSITATAK